MSYTTSIKNELSALIEDKRCCKLSEIAGILNTAGDITTEGVLRFRTENWVVARKYFTLMQKTFNIDVERSYIRKTRNFKTSIYDMSVTRGEWVEKILSATGTADGSELGRISGVVVRGDCCKRSYLRGAFLAGGSIADPEKEYHLEISLKSSRNAEQLVGLLSWFDINAKMLIRPQGISVYAKDSTKIADFLNVTGAKNALFSYENAKVMKEVRNDVNRLVNCDTANIRKTVDAAQRQLRAIELIEKTIGLSSLTGVLRKTAEARIENPELKLEELGLLLGVGKSGINHRFRKIEAIAKELEHF